MTMSRLRQQPMIGRGPIFRSQGRSSTSYSRTKRETCDNNNICRCKPTSSPSHWQGSYSMLTQCECHSFSLADQRQATVETATSGSEFVATRIAMDQIIDFRYTLMYLGVPVRSKSCMFGDNKSVVDSANIPTSTLSQKSSLASYDTVRETTAAGYLLFNWQDLKSILQTS